MCGIFGLVGERKSELEEALPRGTRAMPHRGPDDEGIDPFCWLLTRIPVLASARGLDLAGRVHEPRGGLGGTWCGITDPASPSVSVCIPTYKRPSLLKRAIASVFAQTYKALGIVDQRR